MNPTILFAIKIFSLIHTLHSTIKNFFKTYIIYFLILIIFFFFYFIIFFFFFLIFYFKISFRCCSFAPDKIFEIFRLIIVRYYCFYYFYYYFEILLKLKNL